MQINNLAVVHRLSVLHVVCCRQVLNALLVKGPIKCELCSALTDCIIRGSRAVNHEPAN